MRKKNVFERELAHDSFAKPYVQKKAVKKAVKKQRPFKVCMNIADVVQSVRVGKKNPTIDDLLDHVKYYVSPIIEKDRYDLPF